MADATTSAAATLLGGDSALSDTARLLFGAKGNVAPGYGLPVQSAWSGASKLLAGPSSDTPYQVTRTGGQGRNITGMSFPEARKVDYSKIVEENNAAKNQYAGGLAEAAYQKNLLENAKKWMNDINTSGDLRNMYREGIVNGNAMGGLAAARKNYDLAKSGLSGLTADEKTWLASQGVNIPSNYPAFHL